MTDRHRKPRRPPATRARTGPFCGAKRRSELGKGKTCRQPAGYKTDHPGQGRCWLHMGNARITHGRYSTVVHQSVRDALDQLASLETNAMDLLPEANLLRALTVDFINRYHKMSEALLAWHADGASNTKPRKILDLADAGRLVEAISRVIHRIHQIQSTGAISLDTFRRVTEMMGVTVARHVKDEKILTAIEADWATIALDAKPIRPEAIEDPDIEEE